MYLQDAHNWEDQDYFSLENSFYLTFLFRLIKIWNEKDGYYYYKEEWANAENGSANRGG